jgi:DNA-binding transcriptional MerR regulator
MTELLSIGRFARLSGLTIRAIRHYGELGLLNAAHVDESTGYRYFTPAQLGDAEAIRRLRALELPLDEIRELLGSHDPAHVRDRLAVHRARLERRAAATQRILDELQRLIDGEEALVPGPDKEMIRFELSIQDVAPRHGLGIRVRAHVDEMGRVIPEAIDEVHAYLEEAGLGFAGAPFCICPFGDDEGYGVITVGWPVAEPHGGRGRIEPVQLPSGRALVFKHTGPYDALGRSYRLMSEVMADGGLQPAGDPVELYETDPKEVENPNDYETVIVWPVGPEGDLPKPQDTFQRRVEVGAG